MLVKNREALVIKSVYTIYPFYEYIYTYSSVKFKFPKKSEFS